MQAKDEASSDEFSGRLGLIFATIGAAIGTGRQKVKVIDHHKTRKEGKTVYREEYVDAYPLQDLVGGYLQNTFGIIRNAHFFILNDFSKNCIHKPRLFLTNKKFCLGYGFIYDCIRYYF